MGHVSICAAHITLAAMILMGSVEARAAAITPGNILVTYRNTVREYTRTGSLLQSFTAPQPNARGDFEATDAVVDRFGNIQVIILAPYDDSYWGTLNPITGSWQLKQDVVRGLGTLSDREVDILGDVVYSGRRTFDVVTRTAQDTHPNIMTSQGLSEISVGRDGLLYALSGGSPNP